MNKPVFYIIFVWSLIFQFIIAAQENLVPNGSFEEYYSCPVSNDLNNDQLELAKGWWKPTLGTSDYFNRCNNGVVGVPSNFWGYQEPCHGDGYVGLVAIGWDKETSEITALEYVQTRLTKSLVKCGNYHFSMYVSCADYSQYGLGRLGAYISNDSVYNQSVQVLEVVPQITYNVAPIVDTIQWTKIEGSFIANGDEQFLTIGYFFDDITDDTTFIQSFPQTIDFAVYYYIDSVELTFIDFVFDCDMVIPNIFTPNNDGINDVWQFKSYIEGELYIMNRWGNIVYHETGLEFNWECATCVIGVYYYKFITNENIKTGFIHLIR